MKYLHELVMEDMPKEAQVILPELETLDFIRQGRNLVLYGNPGTGKTHIATALGIKACQQDFTVLFTSVPVLLTQIREAKSAKTLRTLQLRFEKYDLVICDEFGYVSCDKEGGELLFNHLSLRAGKKATIITTNLAFNRWNEIIKDKVLVAAMVGLDARATMDLDATIKGTNVSVEDVEMIISQIISIPLDDGVSFRVKRISEIMEEADYPGVRVSMETKFDGVITPLKIDISTGDVITPREIKYKFNLMLEDRTIEVWAYNLETVLAEKLETVVSRNVTNTRMRDFYDIYILQKLYGEQLQKQVLWTALVATAKKRGTLDLIEAEDIREIFDEIESSPVMETLWKTYQKNYSYAADISWHAIVKSICALYGSILENMYDT